MTHHHLDVSRVAAEDSEGKGGEAARGSTQAKAHPRASIGCVKHRAIGIYLVELLELTTWGAQFQPSDQGFQGIPGRYIPPARSLHTPSSVATYPHRARSDASIWWGHVATESPVIHRAGLGVFSDRDRQATCHLVGCRLLASRLDGRNGWSLTDARRSPSGGIAHARMTKGNGPTKLTLLGPVESHNQRLDSR